jgi:hypothetical protein
MTPVILGPEDIPVLLTLQDLIISLHGEDRIWVHDERGLERLFALGPDFLALGVREGPELVAASLSRRMDPSEVRPIVPGLPWSGEPAHIGLNTLSLPGRGAGAQMVRLLRARRDHLRGRGVEHLFGGIAPDHPVSLGCALRAGAIGVGHLEVPGATELLLWHGPGGRAPVSGIFREVPAGDLEGQGRLMRAGFVIIGLVPGDRSRFRLVPLLPGEEGA